MRRAGPRRDEALLDHHGAEVTCAASVGEAIAALERAIPDVLVTDLAMPHEDGDALLHRVRALEGGQRVRAAGFAAHLAKPVEPQQVVRAVAQAAGRRADPG
jgi:CheY-like chemotaxis protein